MGLTRRTSTGGGGGPVTVTDIHNAFVSATTIQKETVKNDLNISGFHYSGSGFYFFGDNIQIDNKYVLDSDEDNS
jgi:hypothetical protein